MMDELQAALGEQPLIANHAYNLSNVNSAQIEAGGPNQYSLNALRDAAANDKLAMAAGERGGGQGEQQQQRPLPSLQVLPAMPIKKGWIYPKRTERPKLRRQESPKKASKPHFASKANLVNQRHEGSTTMSSRPDCADFQPPTALLNCRWLFLLCSCIP